MFVLAWECMYGHVCAPLIVCECMCLCVCPNLSLGQETVRPGRLGRHGRKGGGVWQFSVRRGNGMVLLKLVIRLLWHPVCMEDVPGSMRGRKEVRSCRGVKCHPLCKCHSVSGLVGRTQTLYHCFTLVSFSKCPITQQMCKKIFFLFVFFFA